MDEELFREIFRPFKNGIPLFYKTVGVMCLTTGILAGSYGNIGWKLASPLISIFGVLSYGMGKEMEWENEASYYKEMLL